VPDFGIGAGQPNSQAGYSIPAFKPMSTNIGRLFQPDRPVQRGASGDIKDEIVLEFTHFPVDTFDRPYTIVLVNWI
jgi:hypothetical protein